MMKRVLILDNEAIQQKTTRIAYQIVEDNYDETELFIIGIKPNGLGYAQHLKKEIESIDGMKVTLIGLELTSDKEVKIEVDKKTLDDKVVIIVDDVANTGKTLYYALKPVMEFSPKKVRAVVLVDRQHKLFPVSPDFVGLSLSTTLQEHIVVEFDTKGVGAAYLI